VKGSIDVRHCMLVSDDRSVNDLLIEGHMDHILRKAISEGMDALTAIQLATINPATYMHVDNEIGSISPGCYADILLASDLETVKICKVIANGKEISSSWPRNVFKYPRALVRTLILRRRLKPSDFMLKCRYTANEADFRVIRIMEDTILTKGETARLGIRKGTVIATEDVLYAAVIERHHRTGNIGRGLVTGLGRFKGAIAQSIAHDSHNVIVVGSNPFDMVLAAQTVFSMQGGVALSERGKIVASLKLGIAGLMSTESADVVARKKGFIESEGKKLGLEIKSPIASLSFLSLAVIPELRLTDKGLFDVTQGEFVGLIMQRPSKRDGA
jgi:adenine deaminase